MPSAHDFNPATGLSREQYRDNWMSSGISNMNDLKNWLSQNGGQALSDNGTVMTPYGDTLDMGTAFRTGNGSAGWTPVNSMMPQANGSQFNPQQQQNNSVLGNAGSGNIFQSLMGLIQNGFGAQMFNQGAQPYDPHSSEAHNTGINPNGNVSNYWSQKPIPTGQTDGTMLGTSFQSAPTQNNMTQGMNQPSPMYKQNNMTNQQTPMGSPSFYQNRNENFSNKPLPQNNLMGNF